MNVIAANSDIFCAVSSTLEEKENWERVKKKTISESKYCDKILNEIVSWLQSYGNFYTCRILAQLQFVFNVINEHVT